MSILIIIILLFLLLAVLLFTVALKVKLVYDSDNINMNLTLIWLYPFLKVVVSNKNGVAITTYVMNKKLFTHTLKPQKQKGNGTELIKIAQPSDIHVNAYYGFSDPFLTGIVCGAINIASDFVNVESIQHNPDFITDDDYIHIDATAKVNIGTTLVNFLKARTNNL